MASALTNPTMTLRGMNRISRGHTEHAEQYLKQAREQHRGHEIIESVLAGQRAITKAMAPVAAEIMAGRPPTMAMVTAIVTEANNPTRGSTPAMIEKEMASGISASATTRPASTSVLSRLGDRSAAITDVLGSPASRTVAADEFDGGDTVFRSKSRHRNATDHRGRLRRCQPDMTLLSPEMRVLIRSPRRSGRSVRYPGSLAGRLLVPPIQQRGSSAIRNA